jgi:hypothetical protein
MHTPSRLLLTLTVVAFTARGAVAQPVPAAGGAASAPLSQVIDIDPQVRAGRLANGLQYFVRANAVPRGRAELRLVVNAGSCSRTTTSAGWRISSNI